MDFSKIKNLVRLNGDKVILVENDEPEIVVMSFHEYEKIMHQDATNMSEPARGTVDTPHVSDIPRPSLGNAAIGGYEQHSRESIGLPVHLEDIRLEDLPV
ncbi:MAG: hypothetical protein HY006_01115 [Candidatus Sungbacteria bacterium]|nr:hypothetical protein [Candidatus Sungbacteria bacterium]